MHKVMDVRKQLLELCARVGVVVNSFSGRECSEQVRKALLGGLFTNVAEHTGEGKYRTVRACIQICNSIKCTLISIMVCYFKCSCAPAQFSNIAL